MSRLLRGDAARSGGSTRLPGRDAPRPPASASAQAPMPAAATTAPPRVESGPDLREAVIAQALAEARAEIDALRESARADGFEQGRREASLEADAALGEQDAAWRAAIASMQEAVLGKLDESERFAVAVAFEACARVLGDGAANGTATAAVVRQLLAEARETAALRVQLPPADVDAVRHALREDPHWQHRSLAFEADPSLRRGECRVVSAHGQLETSLDIQLDAIRRALTEAHRDSAREQGNRE